MTRMHMHRIDIEPVSPTTWRVSYGGTTLIERAKQPALEACRRLLNLGMTGRLEMYSKGGNMLRLSADIERAAGWTLQENRHGRLVYRIYRPWGEEEDGETDGSRMEIETVH